MKKHKTQDTRQEANPNQKPLTWGLLDYMYERGRHSTANPYAIDGNGKPAFRLTADLPTLMALGLTSCPRTRARSVWGEMFTSTRGWHITCSDTQRFEFVGGHLVSTDDPEAPYGSVIITYSAGDEVTLIVRRIPE